MKLKTSNAIGKTGKVTYELLHGMKEGVKDIVSPEVFFDNLGLNMYKPYKWT